MGGLLAYLCAGHPNGLIALSTIERSCHELKLCPHVLRPKDRPCHVGLEAGGFSGSSWHLELSRCPTQH